MNELTLCVGADVHLDEIVLRAVDKTDGHQVLERFHVTNNLARKVQRPPSLKPRPSMVTLIWRSVGKPPACSGSRSTVS